MMTGDRGRWRCGSARELGLAPDEIHAGLLPADKVRLVAALAKGQGGLCRRRGERRRRAGPRRCRHRHGRGGQRGGAAGRRCGADGRGHGPLAEAHRLARRTARIIRQNLAFAIGAMAVLVTGACSSNCRCRWR
jgi:Cd2+/Zn2+-exporting ATPase